jgi:hypothetical protein
VAETGRPIHNAEPCHHCEAPQRQLWPPRFGEWSHGFRVVGRGDWKRLLECSNCGALWFEIPEEPYAAFPYLVAWPSTVAEWERLSRRPEYVLERWHAARLREVYPTLDEADKQAIEHHRLRAYGRAPVALSPSCPEWLQQPAPDLVAMLRDVADLWPRHRPPGQASKFAGARKIR